MRSAGAALAFGLGTTLGFTGCGADAPTTSAPAQTVIRSFVPDAADAGILEEAATAASAPTLLGNPLCQVQQVTSCFPDDVSPVCDDADAGDPDAGGDDAGTRACRVVASGPACFTPGLGMTNATCSQSADCAAGHECISTGTCRHYCCAGNGSCQINEFCDVQQTAQAPSALVPVCMPKVPCVLLDDDHCPQSEQCSVVREDGSTSCVTVGTAKVDEPCDVNHCERGLVCLGGQGSRTCAQLCFTALPHSCQGTGKKCLGSLPLFTNPLVGVCQ